MKRSDIEANISAVLASFAGERPSSLRRILEEATERLSQIEESEEEHRRGIRYNDSYYLFRQTSAAEDALANYHYLSIEELNEERTQLKLKVALIPLILEEANDEYDFLSD
jgi:hypothetical protein